MANSQCGKILPLDVLKVVIYVIHETCLLYNMTFVCIKVADQYTQASIETKVKTNPTLPLSQT